MLKTSSIAEGISLWFRSTLSQVERLKQTTVKEQKRADTLRIYQVMLPSMSLSFIDTPHTEEGIPKMVQKQRL